MTAHPVQRQLPPCLGPVGVGESCAVFVGDVLLDDADALLVGGVHDVDGNVLGVGLAGGEGAALSVADDDVPVLVGVGEDGHDHAVELDRVDECPVEVDL